MAAALQGAAAFAVACDFFRLTATQGVGTGESFRQFPVQAGDCLLADRGSSTARGLLHVERAGGRAAVRLNTSSLPLHTPENKPFDLLAKVRGLPRAGMIGSWPVHVTAWPGGTAAGRAGALRKTEEAILIAHKALPRKASKKGTQLQPQTLEFAKYVILFPTFPTHAFPAASVLEWYRTSWQVEPVFRCFKSPAQLGHLPKRDDESAKAWLSGKLFAALLVEKLILHASAITPWKRPRPRSPWRDLQCMLHQVAHAIAPILPLPQALREWHQTSEELADPTRQRTPQLAANFD